MALLNTAAILAEAAAQIPLIIEDGLEREILGKPSFIVDGTPESLPGQIGQAAARSACRQFGAGLSGLTGQAAVNAETVCRPYLDDVGLGSPAAIKQPFNGGQCPALYSVQYSYNTVNTDGTPGTTFTQQTGDILGPIRGIRRTGQPGNYNAVITSGDGVESTVNSSAAPQGGLENLKITQVFRLDGLPDDCGNPPPETTQPGFEGDPNPPPFRFNPSPLIDLPIDVTFNPDGTINVDFGVGDVTVDAFNGGGDGDGGGGGGGGAAPPGDIGTPGTPQATGNAGDVGGEAPEGQVLTGLRVVLTAFPQSRTLLENGVYRGAYYAYMGVPGLLDLDPAGAAATLDQFIFAEQPNLTAWRLRTNRGYNATVTPYYRAPE